MPVHILYALALPCADTGSQSATGHPQFPILMCSQVTSIVLRRAMSSGGMHAGAFLPGCLVVDDSPKASRRIKTDERT